MREDTYVPTYIRTTHPYGFRSGEWAELLFTDVVNDRLCYTVEFSDGVTDTWVVGDGARYEFKLDKQKEREKLSRQSLTPS